MYRVKSHSGIKEVSKELSTVDAYVSIFGNIDSDKEMIMPGAFKMSLSERGPEATKPRIKHLWMHSPWEPIGKPLTMAEDTTGLFVSSKFGTDSFSQDKLQLHIDEIITEFSIGFQIIKFEDVLDDNGNREFRKLTELKLWEYSSVTWGANSLTHITDIKGESKEDWLVKLNARMDKLIKALKSDYSEESKEQFEIEYKQIQEIINSLLKTESGDSAQEQSGDSAVDGEKLLNIFNQINF